MARHRAANDSGMGHGATVAGSRRPSIHPSARPGHTETGRTVRTCTAPDALRAGAPIAAKFGRYHAAMSKLLLNLRHVHDDEAHEVRAMLESNGIAFYETPRSSWGISAGGIYVTDDDNVAEAKRLMAEYQVQRRARVRTEREAAVRAGTAETFWTVLRREPLRVVLTALAIVFLLGLVALPAVLLRT